MHFKANGRSAFYNIKFKKGKRNGTRFGYIKKSAYLKTPVTNYNFKFISTKNIK